MRVTHSPLSVVMLCAVISFILLFAGTFHSGHEVLSFSV